MDLSRRSALAGLAAAACAPVGRGTARGRAPNIMFVLIDDLGFADLSVTGNTLVSTPHIDRLAAEGLVMTQFYTASPICSPSRAGFITGRFPARDGFVSFISDRAHNRRMGQRDWLDPTLPTIPRMLRDVGYATGHFGKWHLGGGRDVGDAPLPAAYGFDESYTQFEGLGPRLLITEDHYGLASASAKLGHGPIDRLPKARTTAVYIDKLLAFAARNAGRPWYAQLWLDDAHDPWVPDADQLAAVRGKGRNADEERFLAVLVAMDAQIGRLTAELERRAMLRDTVIVLTGDNGPTAAPDYYRGNSVPPGDAGPHRGRKASLYEGGIRQPLIVRWPGRVPARKRDDLTIAAAVDLLPTLAAAAGGTPPPGIDGVSLLAAWRGRPIASRPALLWSYGGAGEPGASPTPHRPEDRSPPFAIRLDRWKLLSNARGSQVELYDLVIDRAERRDVVAEHPALARSLTARLAAWRSEIASGRYGSCRRLDATR